MFDTTLILLPLMLCAGVLGALAMLFRLRLGVWVVGMMLFFGGLAVQRDDFGAPMNHTWLRPLQLYRAELFLAGAVVFTVGALAHTRKMSFQLVPAQGLVFLAIQMYAGLLLGQQSESAWAGISSVAFALAACVPLMLVLPAILREPPAWLNLMRAIGLAGGLWCGGVVVQMLINRHELMVNWGRRLTGLHGNPQGAAEFLGPVVTVAVWLSVNEVKRGLRVMWMLLAGTGLILLAWTGSRTGAAMCVVGLIGVLLPRMGRAVLVFPLLLGVVYAVWGYFGSEKMNMGVQRLTDTTDTRSQAWKGLLSQFLASPLFGSGRAKFVENSYLLGLAAYGIFMGVLLLLLLGVTGVQMLRLWRCRAFIDKSAHPWIYLIIAFNVMYFGGAMADGYILSRLEGSHVLFLSFAALTTVIIRVAHGRMALDGHLDESEAPEHESGPWDTGAEDRELHAVA